LQKTVEERERRGELEGIAGKSNARQRSKKRDPRIAGNENYVCVNLKKSDPWRLFRCGDDHDRASEVPLELFERLAGSIVIGRSLSFCRIEREQSSLPLSIPHSPSISFMQSFLVVLLPHFTINYHCGWSSVISDHLIAGSGKGEFRAAVCLS
jgi:hypothetical protein